MESGSVLIVDSDGPRREGMSRLLRTHGCERREAASGREALGMVSREEPDVILLRIGSDLEMFHQLAGVSNALIAVLIERGLDGAVRREVLSLKADAFLSEDLRDDELIASIGSLIRQKRLLDDLKRSIRDRLPQTGAPRDGMPGNVEAHPNATWAETADKSSPLRDRRPELYQALLRRYEEAVKRVLNHRIYKMREDAFEPCRQIARELFRANATARDALELHYQTLRKIAPAPEAPRAQAYLEVGRTTIIGLMGDLLTCYRDARKSDAFETHPHSNPLQEEWSERTP